MPKISTQDPIEFGVFWGQSLKKGLGLKAPIIEHFLYEKDTIFISAQTGVGKSIFVLQLMANLTTGTAFLDSFNITKPCKVLYVQTEGDRAETMERVAAMEKGVKIDHNNWVHANFDGICLNTSEGLGKFMGEISKTGMHYDVIIIDPLYTTVKGSLNSDDIATDWVRNARYIRKKYNCAFIVNHHDTIKQHYAEGKRVYGSNKNLMGSTFWGAFATYTFKLSVDKQGIYTLSSGKERNRYVIDTLSMRMIEPEPLMFVMAGEDHSLSQMQIMKLLGVGADTKTVKDIMDTTGLSRATCYRAFRKLVSEGKIVKVCDGHSIKYKGVMHD